MNEEEVVVTEAERKGERQALVGARRVVKEDLKGADSIFFLLVRLEIDGGKRYESEDPTPGKKKEKRRGVGKEGRKGKKCLWLWLFEPRHQSRSNPETLSQSAPLPARHKVCVCGGESLMEWDKMK